MDIRRNRFLLDRIEHNFNEWAAAVMSQKALESMGYEVGVILEGED